MLAIVLCIPLSRLNSFYTSSYETACSGARRILCSDCGQWRIVDYSTLLAMAKDAHWTCASLRCLLVAFSASQHNIVRTVGARPPYLTDSLIGSERRFYSSRRHTCSKDMHWHLQAL